MNLIDKIVELVPEIEVGTDGETGEPYYRSITLADVLRAIEIARKYFEVVTIYPNGIVSYERQDDIGFPQEQSSTNWNFSKNLEGQSDETKAFLSKILGV